MVASTRFRCAHFCSAVLLIFLLLRFLFKFSSNFLLPPIPSSCSISYFILCLISTIISFPPSLPLCPFPSFSFFFILLLLPPRALYSLSALFLNPPTHSPASFSILAPRLPLSYRSHNFPPPSFFFSFTTYFSLSFVLLPVLLISIWLIFGSNA